MRFTRVAPPIFVAAIVLSSSAFLGKHPGPAISQQDRDAIVAAALDYIDGFYDADETRMTRALHPEVAKRDITRNRETGDEILRNMTADQLVEVTGSGGGRRIAERDGRRSDVQILDVFGNLASVRVDAITWIDYLHIGKINDEWKIINVLWGWRSDTN